MLVHTTNKQTTRTLCGAVPRQQRSNDQTHWDRSVPGVRIYIYTGLQACRIIKARLAPANTAVASFMCISEQKNLPKTYRTDSTHAPLWNEV
jgi:hypothetical protein